MAKRFGKFLLSLILPLSALILLVVFDLIWFNLFNHVNFFSIEMKINNDGNRVLAGNIIDILNGASELAILAIGMTLVTASSKGQDISVGAVAAIAGSVFVSVLNANPITVPTILAAFLAGCIAAIICGAFNGTLVAVFKIQPMIATLILFTAGRPIAYWISGGKTPTVDSPLLGYIGKVIPGIPIPTPIIIVILFGVLVGLVLRFTNLRLYTQAVGINEKSARLNGINAVWIKLISFMVLGVCAAFAGSIYVCKIGLIQNETILLDIEMYAILAVAIGGNVLGGGKFSLTGSVIGAFVIQTLTTTLYAVKVPPTALRACMAVVIIIIVLLGSPIVKEYALKLFSPSTDRQLTKSTRVTENQ